MKFMSIFALLATIGGASAADWVDRARALREPRDVPAATEEEAYQAIVEHDARRVRHLKAKLEEHRRRLADHEAGRRRLSDDEHHELQRTLKAFATHIEGLEKETREDKLEKLDEAHNSWHNMHRLDDIDFASRW